MIDEAVQELVNSVAVNHQVWVARMLVANRLDVMLQQEIVDGLAVITALEEHHAVLVFQEVAHGLPADLDTLGANRDDGFAVADHGVLSALFDAVQADLIDQ